MEEKTNKLLALLEQLPAKKQKQLIQNFIHQTKVKAKLYSRHLEKVTDN